MTQSATNRFASRRQRVIASLYRNRRRVATGSAIVFAVLLGYYAVAGDNGITVYKQKRLEDKQLAKRIEELKQENGQLQAHVERLKSDPDAIVHEAREKLHYARPGEVIYTLRPAPDAHSSLQPTVRNQPPPAASQPAQ